MPIIKSAKKRVRISRKATARNVRTKRLVKDSVKSLKSKFTIEALQKAQSAIDTAVKKGVLSKNKAARKKSKLAAQAKAAGVKLAAKKSIAKKKPAPKPVVKKAPTKKTPVKKTAAKKSPAKKTTK